MSNDTISLELSKRDAFGNKVKALRRAGQVPVVIHDHGNKSIHGQADYLKLVKVYSEAGKHHPVEIKIDGKDHLALIKDVDYELTKRQMRHVVFQAINRDEKVEAEIPVVLVGEIPAEKQSLLVLTHLNTVEVEALPKNLPDQLEVDASSLEEVGDKLQVSDIKTPEGVTVLTEPETVIATVEMPKDQVAEADAIAAEQAEDAAAGEEAEAGEEEGEAPAEGEEAPKEDE